MNIKKLIEDTNWEVNSGQALSRDHKAKVVNAAAQQAGAVDVAYWSCKCGVSNNSVEFNWCYVCGSSRHSLATETN